MLIEEIDQAIVQAHHLQVSDKELLDLFQERIVQWRTEKR
jgi:hypothetical protein